MKKEERRVDDIRVQNDSFVRCSTREREEFDRRANKRVSRGLPSQPSSPSQKSCSIPFSHSTHPAKKSCESGTTKDSLSNPYSDVERITGLILPSHYILLNNKAVCSNSDRNEGIDSSGLCSHCFDRRGTGSDGCRS
jgi:hypothetical protein